MSDFFKDVGDFHAKFGLDHVMCNREETCASPGPDPRQISAELREFRLIFLEEELNELRQAYADQDLPGIADALVDLVYVALGTAHLHGFPFDELWAVVQEANMAKERCLIDHKFVPCPHDGVVCLREDSSVCHWTDGIKDLCNEPEVKHSKRGNANDVIKPELWAPPDLLKILNRYSK